MRAWRQVQKFKKLTVIKCWHGAKSLFTFVLTEAPIYSESEILFNIICVITISIK